MKKVYLVGLSGHTLVVHDILSKGEFGIGGYFELEAKMDNHVQIKER